MDEQRLEEIRARADLAIPGPWDWFGNTETDMVHLATTYGGRIYIVGAHVEKINGWHQTEEPWGFISEEDFYKLSHEQQDEIEVGARWAYYPRIIPHLQFPHRESSYRKTGGHHGLASHRKIARYEVLNFQTREEAGLAPDADRTNSPLYREDFMGLDSPEADFIAHARKDVDYLLAEIDRLSNDLTCALAALRYGTEHDA